MAQVPVLHSFPHALKQDDETGMWNRARQRVNGSIQAAVRSFWSLKLQATGLSQAQLQLAEDAKSCYCLLPCTHVFPRRGGEIHHDKLTSLPGWQIRCWHPSQAQSSQGGIKSYLELDFLNSNFRLVLLCGNKNVRACLLQISVVKQHEMTLKNSHLFYLSFVKRNFVKLPIIFQERCVIFALTELIVEQNNLIWCFRYLIKKMRFVWK